jgi:hypothetical protein
MIYSVCACSAAKGCIAVLCCVVLAIGRAASVTVLCVLSYDLDDLLLAY